MTTALASGTFDLIHPGHLDYLRQAKKHGDRLIVLVARDETVMHIKGKRPLNNERTRLERISHLEIVHTAFLGSMTDHYTFLDEKPDVVCLGYDQHDFTGQLEGEIRKRGLKTKIVRLKPFKPEKWKSSKV
ncbi:MAG: FAD synthase [Nanoarchaeota archaeon]|nr:FAD synthase [Nanoarchaeota archaeon]